MKITVIGCGYVGLVTGACLAELGNEVTCVDLDEEKIAMLRQGACPIHEPGLPELIQRNLGAGRLSFETRYSRGPEVVFLCVGTPSREDGSVDLSQIEAAARSVAEATEPEDYVDIVIKSTVPPGTGRLVRGMLRGNGFGFTVISNPEFLKEGRAVDDFMRPDRVVIGTPAGDPSPVMRKLYAPILRSVGRYFETDNTSAELSKYAANAMLATRISFMNEIALLADRVGADIDDVRQIVGSDSRIGPKFLFPGPGFGGSCFPKDLRGLCRASEERGVPLMVPTAALHANEAQRMAVADLILEALAPPAGSTVAIWGLAFKPGTDDVREAPAVDIARRLGEAGVFVQAHDPEAGRTFADEHVAARVMPTALEAAQGASALVCLTDWPEYKMPDWPAVRDAMRGRAVIDARNLWDPRTVRSYGFDYQGIGRGRP